MLNIDRLHFGYPELPLFAVWSYRFEPGLTWIRGDMGSGKTTLLRLVVGELAPQSGRIWLGEQALSNPRPAEGRPIAWCPGPVEKAASTAREWLTTQMRLSAATEPGLAHELCQDLDLLPHLDKPLLALSTGSRQKLAVVAALCSGRDWVALDDPFAGVDAASVRVLRQVFEDFARNLAADEGGLLVASHVSPIDGPVQMLSL